MGLLRRRPPNNPPVNVVLHYDCGCAVPVDTVYVGWHDGHHVWQTVDSHPPPASLTVDRLPACTSIAVLVEVDDE